VRSGGGSPGTVPPGRAEEVGEEREKGESGGGWPVGQPVE
jgi:hypothetical protein